MANMTLAIPDDLRAEMRQFPEIKWSEVARIAILEKIKMYREAEAIAQKSKFTPDDALELSNLVKKSATRRLLNEYEKWKKSD